MPNESDGVTSTLELTLAELCERIPPEVRVSPAFVLQVLEEAFAKVRRRSAGFGIGRIPTDAELIFCDEELYLRFGLIQPAVCQEAFIQAIWVAFDGLMSREMRLKVAWSPSEVKRILVTRLHPTANLCFALFE